MSWLKRSLIAFLILVGVLSAGLVWVSWSQAQGLIHPERTSPGSTPKDFGIEAWEPVSFTTEDGKDLDGWYFPPIPGSEGAAIVFVHGWTNNRDHLLPEAQILHEQGYGGLLFDLRGHGESGDGATTFGHDEVWDVRAAVAYLKTRPEVNPEKIGLLGHSMGGSIVLLAAAEIPDVKIVVAESAFTNLNDNIDYGVEALTGLPAFPFADLIAFFAAREGGFDIDTVSPVSALDKIAPRPILFIQGSEDEKVHPNNARWLYDAAQEPKELFYVDGAMHRIGLVDTDRDQFEERLVTFVTTYLPN